MSSGGRVHTIGVTIGLVVVALVLVPESGEAQCAMCRSVFASEEGRQLASAFRSGILFLLAAPFVAFGVVATLAIRSRRPRHIAARGNDRDH